MKKLLIERANISSYFSSQFTDNERKMFEKFGEYSSNFVTEPDILITNTETDIQSLWMANKLKNLKLIIHPNSGYDNFNIDFLKESNIPVILGNPIRQEAVVSYCLSCLFESNGNIPWKKNWEAGRNWDRPILCKQNALIIGLGHVGKSLKQKISSLFKHVFVHDPFKNEDQIMNAKDADYIFICAGLNSTTENFINKNFLKDLKSTVTIINPARGKIVNLDDLIVFLNTNEGASAYLDVFPREPFPLEELQEIKNLKTSCHIAGVYSEIEEEIISFEKNVLHDYIKLNREKFLEKYREENLQNKVYRDILI